MQKKIKRKVLLNDYTEFLKSKRITDTSSGFDISENKINPMLFDFQKAIVLWALRRGRAAIFADCGLGKTPIQLEWAKHICKRTNGNILILAPLAVSKQTQREGIKFRVKVNICRKQGDVKPGINITNYEMLNHFKPSEFSGIVLDESSILKSYSGKFRNEIIMSFKTTPYKLACTATPAPNDYMELGNHSEFLGAMSRQEMLGMFFNHCGENTSQWKLKGHAESEYWKWLCSWAVMIRMPEDLGFNNGDFVLPKLKYYHHIVKSKNDEFDGLYPVEARTLLERRQARRDSLRERVTKCEEIINSSKESWIIWCDLNVESDMIKNIIDGCVEIKGADSIEHKEKSMLGFSEGDIRILVTKPSIAGFGMNWQHCSNVLFLGLSDSYEKYYQAVRRCWRFGQKKVVNVHIVASDKEGAVVQNIQRKEKNAKRMADNMVSHMTKISTKIIRNGKNEIDTYKTENQSGDGWELKLGDSIELIKEIGSNSIGVSIFSPPFSSLYTYSNSIRDMGNCKSHNEFYKHFNFLVKELLRVTKSGRMCCFHCMNLPIYKEKEGYIGLRDFRGLLIKLFEDCGWIYHSEVTIWKDPVTAMQRTKAIGLLWRQLKKDSCMSRQGIADYLVIMRKPGENKNPIGHRPNDFPVSQWQKWASPVWMDINQSKTLQKVGKEENDERHICPLQLEVIERCLILWSNEGELVFSPFAGIGSEGYQALLLNRRFVGIELKESYYRQAIKNLREASRQIIKVGLFE